MKWPKNPKIYEINTWQWLYYLSEKYGQKITLENVPIEIIEKELTRFDAVWAMGIWERSPKSKEIALQHKGILNECEKTLRYFSTNDIIGSPYAIHHYSVDSYFGGVKALEKFRELLAEYKILLILDFVPNHVARDHIWTLEKSNLFVKGDINDLLTKPDEFFSIGGEIYAHGKDPYFPPWTDTIQINAFSLDAREKALKTLQLIAKQCDGVRCDMAMLVMNDIFKNTWGERVGPPPDKDYWEDIIPSIKSDFPDFKFIGEVYWDLEWELIKQGFDFCYDKKLYDRLKEKNVDKIKEHLQADLNYQQHLIRFIENHDEQRAIKTLGEEPSMAAATLILTLLGGKLIFNGQMKGWEVHIPVQLRRGSDESDNEKVKRYYDKMMKIIDRFKIENWSLCEIKTIGGGDLSYKNLIAYTWRKDDERKLIVINYSQNHSKAHVIIKDLKYGIKDWCFKDLYHNKEYVYNGKDLDEFGLYVELNPWNFHLFDIKGY